MPFGEWSACSGNKKSLDYVVVALPACLVNAALVLLLLLLLLLAKWQLHHLGWERFEARPPQSPPRCHNCIQQAGVATVFPPMYFWMCARVYFILCFWLQNSPDGQMGGGTDGRCQELFMQIMKFIRPPGSPVHSLSRPVRDIALMRLSFNSLASDLEPSSSSTQSLKKLHNSHFMAP